MAVKEGATCPRCRRPLTSDVVPVTGRATRKYAGYVTHQDSIEGVCYLTRAQIDNIGKEPVMTRATLTKMKAALKRDPSVPVGTSSTLHVDCVCDTQVKIEGERNVCPGCQTVYDASGWIVA